MESKQAQAGASDWFGSWLGQCYKVPPTEGELKFEDAETKKKASRERKKKAGKESNKKASKDLQGSSTLAGASSAAIPGPRVEQKSDVTTKRYLIDNSVLQSTRPGIAYRHCKEDSKKVKEMSTVWGEIVDGTDEGDGWLKVGSYYLPMEREGKPIIALVENQGVVDGGLSSEPPARSVEEVFGHTSPPKAAVQKEVAASLNKDVIAEPDKPPSLAAQDLTSSPKNDVVATLEKLQAPREEGALSAGAEVDELKNLVTSAEDEDVDALVKPAEQPQRAWFAQPSVGTWLQVLPQGVVQGPECLVAGDRPIHVEAAPVKWEHCPSVGTWAHRRLVGLAACS